MLAEVIAIGDELTSGQRLDTNSQWLSQQLGELGVTVRYHTTVADDLAANVRVFTEAIDRADIVVASGGLGPTADDLTREAIAGAAGVDLVLDEQMLQHIRNLFARRGRDMPTRERNRVQAMFPRGSRPIPNPHGTAPGIAMTIARAGRGDCNLFAMPGVPAEMFEMWRATVSDAIRQIIGAAQVIVHHRIKCFGVGESDLEQMLPDLIRRGRVPQVGITVSGATITLRITAAGATHEDCRIQMQPTIATIHECLGELVFGEEEDELHHAVLKLLGRRGATLATAEWGTGGLVADWLGSAAEAPGTYLGGIVAQSGRALESLLDVPAEVIGDGTSKELAAEMAHRCRVRFASDYALGIAAFPTVDPVAGEPGAGEPGRFHFAVATPQHVVALSSTMAGHPEILRPRAGKQALDAVRRMMLKPV